MAVATSHGTRRSRLGLFLPVIVLALGAAAWTAFWFTARANVNDAIGTWLAQEEAQGRRWTCPDRSVGGFPFRFELRCENLAFAGSTPAGTVQGSLPRFLAVAQVYEPSHVIIEAQGPLVTQTDKGERLELGWQSLDASVIVLGQRLDRVSTVVRKPTLTLTLPGAAPLAVSGDDFQVHLRRDPAADPSSGTYDLAAWLHDGAVPPLDAVLGTSEPADIELQARLSQAEPLLRRKDGPTGLEAWRQAGGALDLVLLTLAKGPQRLEARGTLALDAEHRPQGRIEASAAGFEPILAHLGLGGKGNLGELIAGGLAILGGKPKHTAGADVAASPAKPGLTPLPPVVLADGRILIGPVALGVLKPLY